MNTRQEENYKKNLEKIIKDFIDDYNMDSRKPGDITMKILIVYYNDQITSTNLWISTSFEVDNNKIVNLKYEIAKLMEEYRTTTCAINIIKEENGHVNVEINSKKITF